MKYLISLFLLFIIDCGKDVNGSVNPKGDSSLIITKTFLNKSVCPSGYGVVTYSGIDVNHDGILNSEEVILTSILCDGDEIINIYDNETCFKLANKKVVFKGNHCNFYVDENLNISR